MLIKVNENILKTQILETLNVPSLKSYWYDTGVTNYLYTTIRDKFGYKDRQGFFSTMVWDDNEFYKPLGKPYITKSNLFCWRVKPDQQKDMKFLEEVYNEWRKNIEIELGLRPDKSKEIFSLESRLSSGSYLKYSDLKVFDNALIELQEYKNYEPSNELDELEDILGHHKDNSEWVKVKNQLLKDKHTKYICWIAKYHEWMIQLNHFNLSKDYDIIVKRIELVKEFNIDISKVTFGEVLLKVPTEHL